MAAKGVTGRKVSLMLLRLEQVGSILLRASELEAISRCAKNTSKE